MVSASKILYVQDGEGGQLTWRLLDGRRSSPEIESWNIVLVDGVAFFVYFFLLMRELVSVGRVLYSCSDIFVSRASLRAGHAELCMCGGVFKPDISIWLILCKSGSALR